MSDFINTIDLLGDDVVMDKLIDGTIVEFKDDQIVTLGRGAFTGCSGLTVVELPNLTATPDACFANCTSLIEVVLPNVTRFASRTFEGCTALQRIDGSKIIHLGPQSAFGGCKSLQSVDFPLVTNAPLSVFNGCSSLTQVNMPSLETSGALAFASCTSLTHICLPKLIKIDDYGLYMSTFHGCNALRVVDVPSATTIASYAFCNVHALAALLLRNPDAVCTLAATNAFSSQAIESGEMFVYVPGSLVKSYQDDSVWSASGVQFRVLEDYTVDGTVTGKFKGITESISLNVSELMFSDATTQTLTATGELGFLEPLRWTSSNSKVVVVNDGVVTPVSDGTAVITVVSGSCSASCAITVNAGLAAPDNCLQNVGFNSGYLNGSGNATAGSGDVYTDKFVVQPYAGSSIHVQLTNVTTSAANSRMCYYTIDNKFISAVSGASGETGIVNMISTVPNNAEYAAISIAKNNNFSINITCDGKWIGEVEYTS